MVACLLCLACNKEQKSSSTGDKQDPANRAPVPSVHPAGPPKTAGARIEGTIQLGKTVKYPVKMSAGFVGKDGKGQPVGPAVGWTVSNPHAASQSASCTTWQPLNAALEFDAAKGWSYKHEGLPPGTYLVFAQWGDHYFDAKWVTVKDASATVNVPLVVDPDQAGKLEIQLPGSGKDTLVAYVPLDEQGKIPLADVPIQNWYEGKLIVKEPKAVLDNVRAGKYRILAFPSGAKPLSADVEVKAGSSTQVELK
jgi:hypothetical protein